MDGQYNPNEKITATVQIAAPQVRSSKSKSNAEGFFRIYAFFQSSGTIHLRKSSAEYNPGEIFIFGPDLDPNIKVCENQKLPQLPADLILQIHADRVMDVVTATPEFVQTQNMLSAARHGVKIAKMDKAWMTASFTQAEHAKGGVKFLYALSILDELAQSDAVQSLRGDANVGQVRNKNIDLALKYIEKQFADPMSLGQVARHVGMTHSTFHRRFVEATGQTFVQFLTFVRIGYACRRLRRTNDQISTICFDAGFQNLANFNRQFLLLKGVTPSQYRIKFRRHSAA